MRVSLMSLLMSVAIAVSSPAHGGVKTIVLVHGAFADGSGWKAVADILQSRDYTVRVVQEPLTTFEADVAAVRRVLDKASPCVLVGHSYGGMVITEAGLHPSVKSLVYVSAFCPTWVRAPVLCKKRRHRLATASNQSVTAFYKSTLRPFQMTSPPTCQSPSPALW